MQDPQPPGPGPSYTVVSFHAHPDDEALFTGGTLAGAAAAGHRVVIVMATAGERGLTEDSLRADLGHRRLRELTTSARALGAGRLVLLGYADSGSDPDQPAPEGSFCAASVPEAAERLRRILTEERADVLTVYDPVGGYGHRDHVRVHDVGLRAATDAGTPVVLEATVEREALQRGLRLARRLGVRPGGVDADSLTAAYRSRREITHVIDVRRQLPAKRAALRAHASQTGGGPDVRTVALLSRLPWPLRRRVLGREWFVDIARPASGPPITDIFATLDGPRPASSAPGSGVPGGRRRSGQP